MSYSMNATDKDCYPGTTVLINKLNITDERILKENEGFITGAVAAELIRLPMKSGFSFDDYKHIHYQLFSELYEWAGKTRTISLSKATTTFTAPENIEYIGNQIFKRLKSLNYFVGLPRNEFVIEIADLYNSLNILHPFREGNGRTERVFFFVLIRNAGYDIDYSGFNSDQLIIGSIQAASGVMDNLSDFFDKSIR